MPASGGPSAARAGSIPWESIDAGAAAAGSKAVSGDVEPPPEDVDPFFEATAPALSSAKATAAFAESWLCRAAMCSSALACWQADVASEVPCAKTKAASMNRVSSDFTTGTK